MATPEGKIGYGQSNKKYGEEIIIKTEYMIVSHSNSPKTIKNNNLRMTKSKVDTEV